MGKVLRNILRSDIRICHTLVKWSGQEYQGRVIYVVLTPSQICVRLKIRSMLRARLIDHSIFSHEVSVRYFIQVVKRTVRRC